MQDANGTWNSFNEQTSLHVVKAKVLRFLLVLAAAFAVQFALILVWSFVRGDAFGLVKVIYLPFADLAEPFVRHYFGNSDGSLAYYFLGDIVLGASVYSIAAGFLALL